MDVTEALTRIRATCERTADNQVEALVLLKELTTEVRALDKWITQGGILPRQWRA